ncbi:hypothetical protein SKAU_G00237390 [Synaphobranchus kaupii]|uniref:Reverse transcriptase n=1 Tax=Synaphobranchus kaupii TaxID=118154 RepID=A0A9Q1F6Z0_SYNKA|nr:hypothetical protein SKAU_G00237390 [Synaphobranchus kaupii]
MPGPRIDQILLRGKSNQSDETQRQEETHSPQSISTLRDEEEVPVTSNSPRHSQVHHKVENMQGRKPLVKWPKSNSKEWEIINEDVNLILGGIKGSVEKKLEKMGDLVYSYGKERFGVKEQVSKKDRPPPPKSRRLQEIQRLVKERRGLKKLWKKATEEERDGINLLQEDLKQRLSRLRRAENLRKRRKKKEKARTDFYKHPFKFLKGIFTKEKSGSLKASKEEVEGHLRSIYADELKDQLLLVPTDIPPISPPQHQFDTSPPKLSEVKEAVKKARSASAPGPNGVPYCVYKNAPDVLKLLWRNMRVAWEKQIIPKAWRRAGGVLIPKEKNSTTIEQFRQINLLNVEGKIFFSVLAKRMAKDVVGQVQQGRAGFGLIQKPPQWHKATSVQKRRLVVEEVKRQEEAKRHTKAVSLAKQGRWSNWDSLEKRKISWRDIWEMEGSRLSFAIRATYDLLPTPQNLKQWYGEDPACSLCQTPAPLSHILTGCTTSLSQGRYTWRHNQVLRQLASILEQRRTTTNASPQTSTGPIHFTPFVPAGQPPEHHVTSKDASILQVAQDWKMEVDLDKKLVFPRDIVATTLRPDMVLWSTTAKLAYVVELTVPWEDGVEEAYERKKNKYSELAIQAAQNGWKTKIFPVEVGCRGFVATSTIVLLKKMGVRGRSLQQAIKSLSNAAEKSSNWLWIKRKDKNWAAKST